MIKIMARVIGLLFVSLVFGVGLSFAAELPSSSPVASASAYGANQSAGTVAHRSSKVSADVLNPGRGIFAYPLSTWRTPSAVDAEALAVAMAAYRGARDPLQTGPLERYLRSNPNSPYRVSLWLNIGLMHEASGDYVAAVADLNKSLAAAGPADRTGDPSADATVDQTLFSLLTLQTAFGNTKQVAILLADSRLNDDVKLSSYVLSARQSLWMMRHDPQDAFICGIVALRDVLLAENVKPEMLARLSVLKPTNRGLSLAALQYGAGLAGMPMRAIHMAPGASIPVPAVMHWSLHHYVAVLSVQNGRYVVDDPAFGRQFIMSRAALEGNGSGYYLVPAQRAPPQGGTFASASEASGILGGGTTGNGPVPATPPNTPKSPPSCPPDTCCLPGCPHYSISLMTAAVSIGDNPVGYHPPIGPDAEFLLSYNQQDHSLNPSGLGAPTYGNLGPQWTDNWLSYVVDTAGSPGSNVSLVYAGGSYFTYSGYNSGTGAFGPELGTGAILTQTNSTTYTRVLPDGTTYTYAWNNGTTTPSGQRLIFLTQITDPHLQVLNLSYDSSDRLTSVSDALSHVTTLQYTNSSYPLQITGVTDPFGRTAAIGYDSSGRLNSLTDAVGMHSSFAYAPNGGALPTTFITGMTTPYGTTTFNGSFGSPGSYPYWVTATDPLGNTERVETQNPASVYPNAPDTYAPTLASDPNYTVPTLVNNYLQYRNTYYWDRATYATITDKSTLPNSNAADYEKAIVYHWQHDANSGGLTGYMSGVLESVIHPLERNLNSVDDISRIWYIYPNTFGNETYASSSTSYLPVQIARVLANGDTQLTKVDYNAQSNVIDRVDPLGRQTNYSYAANGVDLTSITQVNTNSPGGTDTLFSAPTYNTLHEPAAVTDASGNTTSYTYNSAGQVLTVTDPLNETTTYAYTNYNQTGAGNYLHTITDAQGHLKATYTYDRIGRITSWTDSEGYQLQYGYDNLDRLTMITYPDGTTTQYTYTYLDITKVTDRLGRSTFYTYDHDRNLKSVTDPLGRIVTYGYDPDGRLTSLTDADGQKTSWTRDIEGRITKKTFPDGTAVTYAYDFSGRLISRTDALGQKTSYTYSDDDRVTKVAYTNPINSMPTVSFTWDPAYPRINTMTDGTGKTKFAYVSAGENGALQLASEAGPMGGPAKYSNAYDELGRIEQLTVAGVVQDSTSYDAISRDITDVTPLGQFNTAYLGETDQASTVTALGQSISGASGLTTYGYLPNTGDRRLNTISFNAYPSANETITTDDADRVDGRTDGTGKVEGYTYDNADRLTAGNVTAPTAYTETYGLNNADFIGSKSGELTTANNWSATNPGQVNQIGTLTPSSSTGRNYTYDLNGNVTGDGINKYTWDAENRLLSITNTSTGHISTFTYDGLGRRVAITETTGGTSTKTGYLWCGVTLCSAYSSGGITTARYLPDGEVQYSGGTATSYYYERDHLGSVVSMTSSTGATTSTLATDAYGVTLSTSGTPPTFGYAGMFLHQASGLYLTLNRAYDPYSGRWLSRDPVGESGGINLYGYIDDDPENGLDPYGDLPSGFFQKMFRIGCLVAGLCLPHDPHDPGFGPDLGKRRPSASTANSQSPTPKPCPAAAPPPPPDPQNPPDPSPEPQPPIDPTPLLAPPIPPELLLLLF